MEESIMTTRIETDSLGTREIPADAYYGIQTLRAVENYPISGLKPKPSYVEATIHIKRAAAIVNRELGLLEGRIADAIVQAADEVLQGQHRSWFVVDVYQAGAGTSHNMNCNEVLANRAIELLGGTKGDYKLVSPNDHVNMAQSTNDVCPTAIRIASLLETEKLLGVLEKFEKELLAKGHEFDGIVKAGRTHLMDATPVRLGQEFTAYGVNIRKHREAVGRAANASRELGIGGTATGTGLNAHPEYRKRMVEQLRAQLGLELYPAGDYFEAMQSLRPMVELSGALRNLAQDVVRIASDIRLLASGPNTGLAEIQLPPVQPGSSIMPGKVNPSIAEMLQQVCYQVLGCDTTILFAAQAGQLELNVMMPVVAFNLLHGIEILRNALEVFCTKCLNGITADQERCKWYAENSASIATALNPYIGYLTVAEIVKEARSTGKSLRQLVLERGLMTREQLDKVLDVRAMTEPGIRTP
jgi:aspartate ammonia-lyase